MSFPGSLQRRAVREGMNPPIKRAGGFQRRRNENGVREAPAPTQRQLSKERQIQRSRTGRPSLRERVLQEQREQEEFISRNTGRAPQRSDGFHRRLPRESQEDLEFRRSRNERGVRNYIDEREEQDFEEAEEEQQEEIPPPPPVLKRSNQVAQKPKATPPPPPSPGPKRAFVATPTFDSPITIATSDSRLEEYARLCAADAREKGETPILSRQLVTYRPQTIPEEKAVEKELLEPWMHCSDLVVLYTDLGVTPYLSSVIQWANKTGKPIDFRLLGDKWVRSLKSREPSYYPTYTAVATIPTIKVEYIEEEEQEEEETEIVEEVTPPPAPKATPKVKEEPKEEPKEEQATEEKEEAAPVPAKKPATRRRRLTTRKAKKDAEEEVTTE